MIWEHERIKTARDTLRELVMTAVDIRASSLKFNTDFTPTEFQKIFY